MAYVTPYAPGETRQKFKRRIYKVLLTLTNNANVPSELRIVRKFLGVEWERVWKNLHASGVPALTKSRWYASIHDVIPTNDRLAAIWLTNSGACSKCGHPYSLQHRIIECGDGPIIWNWTRHKMRIILRMDHKFIPPQWTLRTAFLHCPPQRPAAILWILTHLVHYRLQAHCRLSLRHYMDYLKYSRRKVNQQASTRPNKAGIWMYSIPRITDNNYWTWSPPTRPSSPDRQTPRRKFAFPTSSSSPNDLVAKVSNYA